MALTPWKLLADRATYYNDHMLRAFPICFELALFEVAPDAEPRVVYVGVAAHEHAALTPLSDGSSPLCARIRPELERGLRLYYRFQGAPTPQGAEALAAKLRAAGPHPWNEEA